MSRQDAKKPLLQDVGMQQAKDEKNYGTISVGSSVLSSDFRQRWQSARNATEQVRVLASAYWPDFHDTGATLDFSSQALRWLVALVAIMALVGHNSRNQNVFDHLLSRPAALTLGGLFCLSFVLQALAEQRRFQNRTERLQQADRLAQSQLTWNASSSDNFTFIVAAVGLIGVGGLFFTDNIIEAGALLLVLCLIYLAKFHFNSAMADQPAALTAHSETLIAEYAALLTSSNIGADRFSALNNRLGNEIESMTDEELTRVMDLIQARYAMEAIAEKDLVTYQQMQEPSAPPFEEKDQQSPPSYYSSIWQNEKPTYLIGSKTFTQQIQPILETLKSRLGEDGVKLQSPTEVQYQPVVLKK